MTPNQFLFQREVKHRLPCGYHLVHLHLQRGGPGAGPGRAARPHCGGGRQEGAPDQLFAWWQRC